MSEFSSVTVDEETGTILGTNDPEKEFQMLEKLGEGYQPPPTYGFPLWHRPSHNLSSSHAESPWRY